MCYPVFLSRQTDELRRYHISYNPICKDVPTIRLVSAKGKAYVKFLTDAFIIINKEIPLVS